MALVYNHLHQGFLYTAYFFIMFENIFKSTEYYFKTTKINFPFFIPNYFHRKNMFPIFSF